jgi:hypothetical protein
LLGDQRGAAVAGVEDLAALAGEEGLGERSCVLRVELVAAFGEAEQGAA